MLDRIKFGEFNIVCDKCGKSEVLKVEDTFFEMIDEAKDNGWEFTEMDEHFCPKCTEE